MANPTTTTKTITGRETPDLCCDEDLPPFCIDLCTQEEIPPTQVVKETPPPPDPRTRLMSVCDMEPFTSAALVNRKRQFAQLTEEAREALDQSPIMGAHTTPAGIIKFDDIVLTVFGLNPMRKQATHMEGAFRSIRYKQLGKVRALNYEDILKRVSREWKDIYGCLCAGRMILALWYMCFYCGFTEGGHCKDPYDCIMSLKRGGEPVPGCDD